MITLYYTDLSGKSVPVNYRIYNKQEGKTKNDYLQEMIAEVLAWGLSPKTVTTDSWYSSQKNLKFFRNKELEFLTGIAKNRSCSIDGKTFTQVQNLEIPEVGLIVYLKNFGQVTHFVWRGGQPSYDSRLFPRLIVGLLRLPSSLERPSVKVFRRSFKNESYRYYIMFTPDKDRLLSISKLEFRELHSLHWGIECYHRAIKQVCGIERFMVRTTEAIRTHFFSAIRAFTQLELMRSEELIENWYEIQRNLSLQVARDFILEHLQQKVGLDSHTQVSVNA